MSEQSENNGKPVLLGKEHDLSAFCSDSPSRQVLQNVHYSSKGYVEATNGMVLLRVPVSPIPAEEFPPVKASSDKLDECLIPKAAIAKALKNVINKPTLPVLGCLHVAGDGDKVTLTATDLDTEQAVTVRCGEGKYPDTEQVIVRAEPTLRICLRSDLLATIAEYARKHGVGMDGNAAGITFEFTESVAPVAFSVPLDKDGRKATGVICPMRVE